jgi:hypothetical protein
MPRRSASWRSLASRSSGSLTVVRFMVCQHTLPDCSLTAVTANLGVRWRTDDQTRGRFSYSSERRRTTTNTRSAVSKNRRGRCRRSHHRHLAPARVRSGRVADTLTTKLTTKPTENRGMWRSVWHELRQPGNTKCIAQHRTDGGHALWQSEGQGFESPRVHQSIHNSNTSWRGRDGTRKPGGNASPGFR